MRVGIARSILTVSISFGLIIAPGSLAQSENLAGPGNRGSTISNRQLFLGRLGFQLYSSRNFPPLDEQLQALSVLGYTTVEFDVSAVAEPQHMRVLLDEYRLGTPSGHFSLDNLRHDLAECIERARLFGIRLIVVPYLAPDRRPRDAQGWVDLGEELDGIAKALSVHSLQLAWHNHDFEFEQLPDGSVPLDRLFVAAPHLGWQADIGWLVRAGQDPHEWLLRHQDRLRSVHLKDVAADPEHGEDGWADLGDGRVDWLKLVPLLSNPMISSLIAEHDNPKDFVRFARRSRDTVASWPFPTSK